VKNNKKCDPSGLDGYDRMRMVQGSEIRTRLCYVIRRQSYLYRRCCVYEKQGMLCVALYWICVVTYTIFGHLRLIFKVKKSLIF